MPSLDYYNSIINSHMEFIQKNYLSERITSIELIIDYFSLTNVGQFRTIATDVPESLSWVNCFDYQISTLSSEIVYWSSFTKERMPSWNLGSIPSSSELSEFQFRCNSFWYQHEQQRHYLLQKSIFKAKCIYKCTFLTDLSLITRNYTLNRVCC